MSHSEEGNLHQVSDVLGYLGSRNATPGGGYQNNSMAGVSGGGLYRDVLESLNQTTLVSGASTSQAAGTAVVNVDSERQFVLAVWIQLGYAFLFGGMVLVAALGNATVVWIVLAHRRMRSVTNYFLVNLSVADLLTSTLNAVFNLVYMLESHWPFGEAYCIFNNFIASLTVACSAFTMAAMSIDRSVLLLCACFSQMFSLALRTLVYSPQLMTFCSQCEHG
ncbi:hypothetical protein HPB48_018715 [Haemaphysalis longicornis]|uniref:G-protein coupled receptors family 1 profile domain-containing protein n=1 Tax=Haemaphysalis longicornis TaxID=44386 RepID=A0A9J6FZF6_HAELO|nr:hypothetical protein HPB48_018715 [Haemaphysalis longicornis]